MSVSALSLTRALGDVSGLLQVVSLLSLVLLLLKAIQFYLRRQWLLKVFHQFPSPPSHWLCGHSLKLLSSKLLDCELYGVENMIPILFPSTQHRALHKGMFGPGSQKPPGEDIPLKPCLYQPGGQMALGFCQQGQHDCHHGHHDLYESLNWFWIDMLKKDGSPSQFSKEKELQELLKRVEEFPCAYPRWMWGDDVHLVVYDPDYMKVVLGRSDPKPEYNYRFLVPWMGTGLLLLEGQTWFQHRRMLTPAFHYDILKPYLGLMADSVRGMLDKWEDFITQDSRLEILEDISLMTLDTIMKCAFSHQGSIRNDRNSQSYIQAIRDLNNLFFSRVRNTFYQNDLIYRLTPEGRWNHQACQLVHQHTDAVIKERKAHLQKEGELGKERRRRHLDFLDILLFARMENGSRLSDKDLRAEVDTFMFAGHDTTASGISWILYALASHPEHQQRCREEIQSLLGDGASITWGNLDQMPYTTMCIKEAMRLYPPVPIISRNLSKPITFPDGRSLPAGIKVALSFYGLHHNPKVWPNPEVFDPSRFALGSNQHSHAFLPFSGGSRNCIGKQFAMNEMKVAVALTLLRFELSLDPSRVPCLLPGIVLKSKNGIYLQLRSLT